MCLSLFIWSLIILSSKGKLIFFFFLHSKFQNLQSFLIMQNSNFDWFLNATSLLYNFGIKLYRYSQNSTSRLRQTLIYIYIEGYVSEREISYRLGFKDRFSPSQQQVNSNLSFPILKRRSVEILICIVSTSPEWVESPFLWLIVSKAFKMVTG